MRSQQIIKSLVVLGSTLTVSMVGLTTANAQGGGGQIQLLQQIAANTNNTSSAIGPAQAGSTNSLLAQIQSNTNNAMNTLNKELAHLSDTYLPELYQFLASWLAPDNAKDSPTPQFQQTFTSLGNLIIQNQNTQTAMQGQLNSDLLGPNASNIQNANDLTYSTLLGAPFNAKDPRNQAGSPPTVNPPYNYIKNASGINITHLMPFSTYNPFANFPKNTGWTGPVQDQARYQNYVNTVMAVASYNGFVLSDQYADGNQFTTLQQTLINQATNPKTWFTQVTGTETLGVVMRQLLLFQSQIFVLLTQLIQTQKQLLTAQVMNNALLIAINTQNEGYMYAYARGIQPIP